MKKELPIVMLNENFGAQYQNYFLSIALTNPQNIYYVYENFIELSVKHEFNNHIDYAFDGIYTCDRGIMDKFIIRGPIKNFNKIIQKSIDNGYYIIVNINEEFLPNRQAFDNFYFRHDLLIIGYNDDESQYVTVGFDAKMKYSKEIYDYKTVENAYYRMQNEWDFELFIFKFNREYNHEFDIKRIKLHLENFCYGGNPNKFYFESFLNTPSQSIEFVNNSYLGEYYGIHVFDYLIERIKTQYKILGKVRESKKLNVLDLRSLNTLRTHCMLLKKMAEDVIGDVPSELVISLGEIEKKLMGVKLLILKYFADNQSKNCRKAVERLQKIKLEERYICNKLIDCFK